MQVCTRCVLPGTYPGIDFDGDGVCNYCRDYEEKKKNKKRTADHFKSQEDLIRCLEKYKKLNPHYDVLVPVSGGVDSCQTLITIVETFQLKPLVFHNDHGFEDETAIENVKKLCKVLDVDLVIRQHELSFMKKLFKYFNQAPVRDLSACHVCGNILYLNALQMADQFNIKLVINGYSKGQAAFIQNTAKARDLFTLMISIIKETGDSEFLEMFIRKYNLLDKQKKFLTAQDLEDEVSPGKIMVIPFYIFNFYKTHKEQLKQACKRRFDWQQVEITYPARTTNCMMIWLNTYVDLKKSGHSLYQDEYSTLVRAGDFTRRQALEDLVFNPPAGLIETLANEIRLDLDAIKAREPMEPGKTRPMAARSVISREAHSGFEF
jgi:hypothetical protein